MEVETVSFGEELKVHYYFGICRLILYRMGIKLWTILYAKFVNQPNPYNIA